MKPIRAGLILVLFFVAVSWADTITLKDGTVLEGEIVSEDAQQVVINVEYAAGSISSTHAVPHAEIAQITRWTAAERRTRAMKRDYEQLAKLQLHPQSSYALEYYDQIISNVFRRFLAEYPESEFDADVRARLAAWAHERDLVASGQTKFRGQWMPAEEALQRAETEQAAAALDQAHRLIAQQRYELAARQLNPILTLTRAPRQVAEARALLGVAYHKWFEQLQQQKQELDNRLAQASNRLETARARLQQPAAAAPEARGPLARARAVASQAQGDYQALGSGAGAPSRDQAATVQARLELEQAQAELVSLQQQQETLSRLLAFVEPRARIYGGPLPVTASTSDVSPAASKTAVSAAAATKLAEPYEPPLMETMMNWFRDYWMFLAAGVLVVLWALGRLTKG